MQIWDQSLASNEKKKNFILGLKEILSSQPSQSIEVADLGQLREELDIMKAGKQKKIAIYVRRYPRAFTLHSCYNHNNRKRTWCKFNGEAQKLLEDLPTRDVVTWSSLIAGYAQNGLGTEALECYGQMREKGLLPNAVTFTCLLKACSILRLIQTGEEIHGEVLKQGLLEKDCALGSALVDMYMKCGAIGKAERVFEELPVRNVVTWTAMIAGYAQHGFVNKALDCFIGMQDEGICPNVVTYVCILKACGSIRSIQKGEEIHVEIAKQEKLKKNIMLGNALVDMYVKCGALAKAQEAFDVHEARDVVTWTTLIVGYAQHEFSNEALKCFSRMQEEGISPDLLTFSSILKACGNIGSVEKGKEIHAKISNNLLKKDITLGTALIDMYVKCRALSKAQELFDDLTIPDTIAWNALIAGYAQIGQVKASLNAFHKMVEQGSKPDDITFLLLLTACNHAGLVDEGEMIFNDIERCYYLAPTIEHYTCIVDLFTHVGQFDKAVVVIQKMSYFDRLPLWLTFLASCCEWKNLELGKWAFRLSLLLDKECPPAYICMGNLYAATMHE